MTCGNGGKAVNACDGFKRVASVSDGTHTITYVYDLLGQLTRVNDPTDPVGGSGGSTWVYTYDLGGNMLTKSMYAYTTGAVGTILAFYSYTYGDSNWKDKLTAVNGVGISYWSYFVRRICFRDLIRCSWCMKRTA
ncbi:MAG: hypothetical protein ACI4O7_13705 [Aristaeellaceae bacterium]